MARNNRLPDFEPRKKRRAGAFSRVLRSFVGWGMVLGAVCFAVAAWGYFVYSAPGPANEQRVVVIPPNSGRADIAALLHQNGVISDARVMSAVSLLQSFRGASLKPGEYEIPAKASMAEIFNQIASGRVVMHRLTVPEGWTSAMAVARLNANPMLQGTITEIPAEGWIAANTFLFPRGKDRAGLLKEMTDAQTALVDEVWEQRPPDTIIKSKEELVTLASIVEKETAVPDERPRVAAVFINRLKIGMRLQSDPTIIYGIVGGKGKLDRPLTRADIDGATPYNTYVINGLPPGPIAVPGRASLEAVLRPANTRELYFVADGTGGHAFAETLEAHNENVKRWRAIEAGQAVAQPAPSAAGQPDANELEQLNAITPPQVIQPALPDVPAPQPEPAPVQDQGEAPSATPDTTAVASAEQELPQTAVVLQPAAESSGALAPAITTPGLNQAADISAAFQPGTIMKFGERLVPIPALKQDN